MMQPCALHSYSHKTRLFRSLEVFGGVYTTERLPGRHLVRVWAALDTDPELSDGNRRVGAEPVRIEIKRRHQQLNARRSSLT